MTAPTPATVTALFEARAQATGDRVALAHAGTEMTYAQLNDRANRIGQLLAARAIGPGQLVAVLMDRSADLIAALLGVLKTGAGYVPLALDDPPIRIRSILDDCAATALLTSTAAAAAAGAPAADGWFNVVLGDPAVEAALAAVPDTAPPAPPGGVAYVIYTSGSTGLPKGVVVGHAALSTYLAYAVAHYPGLAGRALLHSSVSFDLAVTSVFGPLIAGGTIEIIDLMALLDGAPLPPGFTRPTFLKVTPSHLALLNDLPADCSPSTDLVVGGEALLGTVLEPWRRNHPGVTVVNEYGPTEATVGCCVHFVRPGDPASPGPVPIGRPIDGTILHVLSGDGRPITDGTIGELYIGGPQLADGYLGQPDLTAASFVDGRPGRMYRTGDLVRARDDGELEFIGRADEQVKISGYRVEPGEIAEAIAGFTPGLRAAVVPHAGNGAAPHLVAYVATGRIPRLDINALRRHVAATVPGYMVPAAYVTVAELPLTPNGKLDRAQLPRYEIAADVEAAPPLSRDEALLRRLFQELTGAPGVGIDDDFLALGGSSILAVKLVTRARAAGLSVGLVDVLRRRTVRNILRGAT